MITSKNYYTEITQYLSKLPGEFRKSHDLVDKITKGVENWETYESNPTIKRVIDLYLTKLNEWIAAQAKPLVKRERKAKEPKAKREKKAKVPKPAAVKPGTPVERITEELRFIRRYVNMKR